MLTEQEGKAAVKLARATIESYLKDTKKIKPYKKDYEKKFDFTSVFREKRGVFVTLRKQGFLRGCIGHPYPDSLLVEAIIDSAISAACQDPRFSPVKPSEMKEITIEVTILTQPEKFELPAEKLPEAVEIGRHGLFVKQGYFQGLLLPQVAPENNFDALDFLSHTCMKAGLSPEAWLTGAEVYHFEGQIFKEKEAGGEIFEEKYK
ncbi:MAG: TIGR00296 family protein [Methanosarcinaceae archaeon]|nr:TIGR00296 family protein [Methanosarcinaceae archaeon]MDD4332478.1 TIGR00296 family protein [Methanosarcinaceae archaeon]MDD4748947.1 TIGR00296 family protein [Methanosarcinaceae archaeon]